ncbi:MAG: protein translocase subunit SecD [Deltaproteobacteria bacterium]|nr:protein translocase subunit SecD [Deltaproteobacteria bacterium]
MKTIFWRLVMLGAFTLLALILFLPSTSVYTGLPSFWADNVPKIGLGLDLQGGMHIVLEVDQEKAIETHVERLADAVEASLTKGGIKFESVKRDTQALLTVSCFADCTVENLSAIKSHIKDSYPVFSGPTDRGTKLIYELGADETKRIKEWAVSQALETIRNRIDKFGVREPVIQRQGDREIAVQLPGLKDPERAIALIGKTAMLQFRLLDEKSDPTSALKGVVPYGDEILYQRKTDPDTGEVTQVPFLVKKETLLTGDLLSDARVAFDSQFNEPYVSITLNPQGARIFEKITGQNVGKRLAIILDDTVYSAPQIREEIGGGKAQITGGFAYDEAVDLAIVLRAGALPAPVNIVQNVIVGPTLGKDSIEAGVKAALLGAILVLGFMVFYYRLSGVIADLTVLLNITMLLGAMAYFNATLTLPGIAGIILTIGMGVDSNVLIFERIKEELRAGRTPRSAVNAGYDRAWWTIIDSHVTTLITAAVLFQFGSGPIKGFAVSLSLGILINLFTALVGTKVSFDIQNEKLKVKSLSI